MDENSNRRERHLYRGNSKSAIQLPSDYFVTETKDVPDIAVASFIFLLLAFASFTQGSDFIISNHAQTGVARVVIMTIGTIVFHVGGSSGAKGYFELLENSGSSDLKTDIQKLWDEWEIPRWSFDISVLVSIAAFVIHSWLLHRKFGSLATAAGYYEIRGTHWQAFALYQMFAFSALICFRLYLHERDVENPSPKWNTPFILSAGVWVLLAVEIVLIYSGNWGTHVVEF